jgi:hypothetical protein
MTYPKEMMEVIDLPNVEGYEFTMILTDGTRVPCVVVKDPISELHHVAVRIESRAGWLAE